MLALSTLMRCIQKVNPNVYATAHTDWHYDITPAGVHLRRPRHPDGDLFICSVSKGYVPERTIKNSDGSIKSRGYNDLLRILQGHKLIKAYQVKRYIERALVSKPI